MHHVGPNPKNSVLQPISGQELEESPEAFQYVWQGQRSTLVECLGQGIALRPDIILFLEFCYRFEIDLKSKSNFQLKS
jgi:hypothetical protein